MKKDLQDIQLACFSLGESLFAVDIMRIKEIILPQRLSTLPRSSELLEGVINLRGAVLPVMDLRKRFCIAPADPQKPAKLLIVSLSRQALALMVDDVLEVITVSIRDIKPPPDVDDAIVTEYLLGICLSADRVFMILNIDALVSTAEFREILSARLPASSQAI